MLAVKSWYYSWVIFRTLLAAALLLICAACQSQLTRSPDLVGSRAAPSLPAPTITEISAAATPILATQVRQPTIQVARASPTAANRGLNLTNPNVETLAKNLSNPDDLVLAPDGSFYVSDIGDGSIRQYSADGKFNMIVNGLDEPEGMVFLPDTTLIIAEQSKNRLLRYDPRTRSVSVFAYLKNKTNQAGIDGIALDDHNSADITLIIPDSPNGVILRASLDGKRISEIAHGFSRPTAAWVEKDGSILVVDENAHSLTRIHPDGSLQLLAHNLPTPDDVIEDNTGHIFVNTLADGAIHMLSVDGDRNSVLVNNLAGPQGEIFDSDGNLVVTDSDHGRLLKIMIH